MHPFLDLPPSLGDAILSLSPTAYWPLDDNAGALRDAVSNRHPATVTGSPTYAVAAPSPIGRGVTWSGTGQYALTGTGVPAPSSSLSVVAFIATTNATAASRMILTRTLGWDLWLNAAHVPTFQARQASNASHAVINSGAPANDGAYRLIVGTFDGTTIICYSMTTAGVLSSQSSAALIGTWNKAPASGVGIAHYNTGTLFTGTIAHCAVLADQVLTVPQIRWLGSVAFGG